MGENRAVSIKNIIHADSEKGLAFLGAPMSINKSKSDPPSIECEPRRDRRENEYCPNTGGGHRKNIR
jgi:hypothetical protein